MKKFLILLLAPTFLHAEEKTLNDRIQQLSKQRTSSQSEKHQQKAPPKARKSQPHNTPQAPKDNFTGKRTKKHQNGKLKEYIPYLNNQIHGKALYFDLMGNLVAELHYTRGIKQKEVHYHKDHGNYDKVKKIVTYKAGIIQKEIRLHTKGNKAAQRNFVNGLEHGTSLTWHKNGKLYSKTPFKAGLKHGLEQQWHYNGKLASKATYKNNLKEGTHQHWDDNGNKTKVAKYKNDLLHGKTLVWDQVSQLITPGTPTIFHYKNGELIKKTLNGKKVKY